MSGDRLLGIIRADGGKVLKTIQTDKPAEFTTANGRFLWAYAVERLIRDGALVPADNGLFGDPTSYQIAEYSK